MRNKILAWLAIAFVVFYVTTNPTRAADTTSGLLGWLGSAAVAFGDFLARVTT